MYNVMKTSTMHGCCAVRFDSYNNLRSSAHRNALWDECSWLPLRLCSEVSCTLSYLKEVFIAVSSVHIHGSHHNLAQGVPHLPLSLTSAMQHGSSMIISIILWNRLSFNLSHKFLAQWPH